MTTDPRQLAQEALALDAAAQDARPSTPVGALAQLERLGRLYDMCQPLATALLAALDERDELRLTLAAEQGRAEGAPFSSSPRLRAAVNAERIRQGLSWRGLAARIGVSSSGFTRWNAGHELSVPAYLKVCDWLRSAMLAADAATAPCAGPAPASTASPPTGP